MSDTKMFVKIGTDSMFGSGFHLWGARGEYYAFSLGFWRFAIRGNCRLTQRSLYEHRWEFTVKWRKAKP